MSSMPRLAQFPCMDGVRQPNLDKVPVDVISGWIVEVHGPAELSKIGGLPARTLAELYPEDMRRAAVFAEIRETPALAQIQLVADVISEAVESVMVHSQSPSLILVSDFNNWFRRRGHWLGLGNWLEEVPDLRAELGWVSRTAISKVTSNNFSLNAMWGTYCLFGTLAAARVGPLSLQGQLAGDVDKFKEVFTGLGLPELSECLAPFIAGCAGDGQ